MYEKEIEDILFRFPEIIEAGLEPMGRQVPLYGKRADLLFKDVSGRKLVVELKRGEARREHVGQLIEYLGSMLRNKNEKVRAMLIAGYVPPSMQVALDYFGIEWKEISGSQLVAFLRKRGEAEVAARVIEIDGKELNEGKLPRKSLESAKPGGDIYLVDRVIEEVLKPLGKKITARPGHRYTSYFMDGIRFAHFYDRSPNRIQLHLEKRYLKNSGLIFDKDSLAEHIRVNETKEDYPIYIFEDTNLPQLAEFIRILYS